MLAHQRTLPTLPVPSLEETLEKYLRTVRPFLSPADYERTRERVQQFSHGDKSIGHILHQRLLERAAVANKIAADYRPPIVDSESGFAAPPETREAPISVEKERLRKLSLENQHVATVAQVLPTKNNWLIDWWNEYSYLRYREALVLNVSFFFVLNDDPHHRSALERAASLLHASLAFRQMIVEETLPPDMMRNVPSCMQQFQFLFNSCRVPQHPSDTVRFYDPHKNQHVAILRNNRIFQLNIVVQGKPLTEKELQSQLARICEQSPDDDHSAPPVGLLTATHRDVWSINYQQLRAHSLQNAETLDMLQSSILVLCLDESSPVTREEISHACWHNYGLNRWFDKTVQLIVFRNGRAGFLGEHSMVDATTPSRYCDYICEISNTATTTADMGPSEPMRSLPPPHEMLLSLPGNMLEQLGNYGRALQKQVDDHEICVFHYTAHGKDFIKSCGLSPDSYVQMAIQLAYYKLMGTCAATYESAGMKRYAWGRTETCRSVSTESAEFVKAMEDHSISEDAKAACLRKAVQNHSTYMMECLAGKGIDRHLLGLRLSVREGEPLPGFFVDLAYNLSCHWTLSTSQIPSNEFENYGWGEVVPDGFGIAYMTRESRLIFNIAGLVGDPVPNPDENGEDQWWLRQYKRMRVRWMRTYLERALDEMRVVLTNSSKVPDSTGKKKAEAGSSAKAQQRNAVDAAPLPAETPKAPVKPQEGPVASPNAKAMPDSRLGYTLAYPTRTAAETIYLPEGMLSGVVGEDVGFIEFEWGEKKDRRGSKDPNKETPYKKSQSESAIVDPPYMKARKLFRVLKDWAPTFRASASTSSSPTSTHLTSPREDKSTSASPNKKDQQQS